MRKPSLFCFWVSFILIVVTFTTHILFLKYPWYSFHRIRGYWVGLANSSFNSSEISFQNDFPQTVGARKKQHSFGLSPPNNKTLERNLGEISKMNQKCRDTRMLNVERFSVQQELQPELQALMTNLPRVDVINSSYDLSVLTNILDKRLSIIKRSSRAMKCCSESWHRTCYDDFTLANSCDKERGCLQTQLPQDTHTRIKQLVQPSNLHLRPRQLRELQDMAETVTGTFDIVFLSAASSNHYLEVQALLHSLHTNVFPFFKNFSFIVYDLGFTSQHRKTFKKFCRCKLMRFNFSRFAEFARDLKKFAWKPYLVKAHLHQARVLIWMDASIRFFRNPTGLRRLLTQDIQTFGVLVGHSFPDSCFTTCRATYHKFGDEPCAYLGLPIFQASVLIFHNDPFVHRVIVEPWAACAFDENCIAPRETECTGRGCSLALQSFKSYQRNKGAITYGQCHHYDQAVITLILHKLYLQFSPLLRILKNETLTICRGDYYDYFGTLE